MRAKVPGLLLVLLIAASCGTPDPTSSVPAASAAARQAPVTISTPTPVPTARPTVASTPGASGPPAVDSSAGPSSSAAPGSTFASGPSALGRWEPTGSMMTPRGILHAVRLGDGTVIALGNAEGFGGCVRPDSTTTEVWSPATGTWAPGPSLNAPRAEFAAAGVGNGGVLVTGGVTAGDGSDIYGGHQSYSSTYVYDPRGAAAGWAREGLLGQARTLPLAATLRDGRVLVAGGYYLSGKESAVMRPSGERLVAFRADGGGSLLQGGTVLADISPPMSVPALATAELFDPVRGTWSATGPLRYARLDAVAATLDDGRVLVVGSGRTEGGRWNYTQPTVDGRAFTTAEVFDPLTGRFSLAGTLPPVDWSPLATFGPYPISYNGVTSPGTLVALPDGGALLVGEATGWSIRALDMAGVTVRTMRFDAATRRWTVVDERVVASRYSNGPTPTELVVPGFTRTGAIAARLADGRVLIAGGRADEESDGSEMLGTAEVAGLYDPATNAIISLAPMPEGRFGAAATLLADGSVLVVGGRGSDEPCVFVAETEECPCETRSTGLASAVRFIPGP
jgi:hypothetical protein